MKIENISDIPPELKNYLKYVPVDILDQFMPKSYPAHSMIQQKDDLISHFGIIYKGDVRVINEFENGNIFMIEKNKPVSFIGEVALLAGQEHSSVTIETLSDCSALCLPVSDFYRWIDRDIHFLRLISGNISKKLYQTSYHQGSRLFYSAGYLLLNYITGHMNPMNDGAGNFSKKCVIRKNRQQISEEIGMTIRTLNRTISRFREKDLFCIEKGKITVSQEQYENILEAMSTYKYQNKKGVIL